MVLNSHLAVFMKRAGAEVTGRNVGDKSHGNETSNTLFERSTIFRLLPTYRYGRFAGIARRSLGKCPRRPRNTDMAFKRTRCLVISPWFHGSMTYRNKSASLFVLQRYLAFKGYSTERSRAALVGNEVPKLCHVKTFRRHG